MDEWITGDMWHIKFNLGDLKSSISNKEIASKHSLNIPPLDPRIFRLAGSNKKVHRKNRSLVPGSSRRFRRWRHLSSLSGKFALGSKPPPLTRVARTGLGMRLIKKEKYDISLPRQQNFLFTKIWSFSNDGDNENSKKILLGLR